MGTGQLESWLVVAVPVVAAVVVVAAAEPEAIGPR